MLDAADAAPGAVDRAPAKRSLRGTVLGILEAYALLLLLIVAFVFFSVWSTTSDTFLTSENLQILVANQAVIAIVALAALIPLVCNEFDLSVGATAGLSAVFVASLLSAGTAVPLAILIGVAMGAGIGLANAFLVTRVGINGVIATLGVSTLIAGVIIQKTDGQAVVSNIPTSVTDFGTTNWLGIPKVAFGLALVALIVYYLLEQTPVGRQISAFGSNRSAAGLIGLRTKSLLALSFVVAGTLAGAAGVLYVARAGGADPQIGEGFTLPALAAAFLSAAAVKPGRFNVGGTLIAIFFLAVLDSGLNLAGAPPYVASYINGAALIVGVGLAVALSRRRIGGT